MIRPRVPWYRETFRIIEIPRGTEYWSRAPTNGCHLPVFFRHWPSILRPKAQGPLTLDVNLNAFHSVSSCPTLFLLNRQAPSMFRRLPTLDTINGDLNGQIENFRSIRRTMKKALPESAKISKECVETNAGVC